MEGLIPVYRPLAEPLHLTEAKSFTRVEFTDEDALITSFIRAARVWAEQFQGRAFINQTFKWAGESFYPNGRRYPQLVGSAVGAAGWEVGLALGLAEAALLGIGTLGQPLRMPNPPLMAIDAIVYTDTSGAQQTLAASEYQVSKFSEPARLLPAYGKSWPALRPVLDAVQIQFRAGYATPFTWTSGPTLKATRHPYANGDVVPLSNSGGALPTGLAVDTDYVAANAVTGVSLELQALGSGTSITPTGAGSGTNFLGVVPEGAMNALRLTVKDFYDNRDAIRAGVTLDQIVSSAARALLWPERIFTV